MIPIRESAALPAVDTLDGLDAALGIALRACLAACGYDEGCIGRVESAVPGPFDLPRMPLIDRLLTADGSPGAALAALFAYDLALPAGRVEEALGDLVEPLRALGVLRPAGDGAGDGLRSAWRLMPFQGLWILSDRPDAGPEAVMGPGPTTIALARAALPAPGARVLDLGCGAGSLALAALAGGAASAVATDLSARAVAVAAVNGRLNGLPLDGRQGDGFAPVAGERFDLVVCQPPYVIRPDGEAAVTYLHGGSRGDELARRLAVEAPTVLAEGGLALWAFESPQRAGDANVAAALANGLAEPADVVVLTAAGPGLDLLAMGYASVADPTFGQAYDAAARRYRQHYHDRGFTGFQRHLAILRRPARGFAMQIPAPGVSRLRRAALDRLLVAIDAASLGDQALARLRVAPVPEASVTIQQPFGASERAPVHRISFGPEGWCADHEVSESLVVLCSALADAADVAGAIAIYAEACAATAEEVTPQVLALVRDGLRRGLLAVGSPA